MKTEKIYCYNCDTAFKTKTRDILDNQYIECPKCKLPDFLISNNLNKEDNFISINQ